MAMHFVLTDCYESSQSIDNGVGTLGLESFTKDIGVTMVGDSIPTSYGLQSNSIPLACFNQMGW